MGTCDSGEHLAVSELAGWSNGKVVDWFRISPETPAGLRFFVVILNPSEANSGIVHRLYQDRFLPDPFHSIIHNIQHHIM
jgi:hypothetical protein